MESMRLSKIPNVLGHYKATYVEDGYLKYCSFKTLEDGILTATLGNNLWETEECERSILFKKEK